MIQDDPRWSEWVRDGPKWSEMVHNEVMIMWKGTGFGKVWHGMVNV